MGPPRALRVFHASRCEARPKYSTNTCDIVRWFDSLCWQMRSKHPVMESMQVGSCGKRSCWVDPLLVPAPLLDPGPPPPCLLLAMLTDTHDDHGPQRKSVLKLAFNASRRESSRPATNKKLSPGSQVIMCTSDGTDSSPNSNRRYRRRSNNC